MDMDNDEMCGTAHDEVSVCGAHGRFTRVGTRDGGDGSGGWCECVCDEGWSTLQGGDVLLSQMPTLSNPDSSAWCSVNVEESGSAAPTIPPVRQTGTSDSSSSAIAFLDRLSWPTLLGVAVSLLVATLAFRYFAIHKRGCNRGRTHRRGDSNVEDEDDGEHGHGRGGAHVTININLDNARQLSSAGSTAAGESHLPATGKTKVETTVTGIPAVGDGLVGSSQHESSRRLASSLVLASSRHENACTSARTAAMVGVKAAKTKRKKMKKREQTRPAPEKEGAG